MCWGGRQTWVWTLAEALTNYITWNKFLHLHTGDNNVYLTEEVTQPNCDYQTGSNIITIITTIKSSGSYLGWPIKECQKIPSLFSLFMAKLLFLSRNRLNLQIKLSVNLPGYLLPQPRIMDSESRAHGGIRGSGETSIRQGQQTKGRSQGVDSTPSWPQTHGAMSRKSLNLFWLQIPQGAMR